MLWNILKYTVLAIVAFPLVIVYAIIQAAKNV